MSLTGVVDALPILDYIKDPAPDPSLSASIAHLLLTKSAKHAWLAHPRLNVHWEPDASAASEIGTIAHAMLLEGDESRVVIIDADDYRTKVAQAKRDEARATGKLPILAARMDDVRAMVVEARVAVARSELRGLLDGGRMETTLIWQEGGAWCRCRPDIINEGLGVLVDYKSTGGSAEPDAWSRGPLLGNGYDLQGAMQRRGAAALLGGDDWGVVYMVQETDPPYAVSFVGLDSQFTIFADAKLDAALATWRTCLATNEWPAYPERICWASPPEYAVYRFGERVAMMPDTGEGTVEDL